MKKTFFLIFSILSFMDCFSQSGLWYITRGLSTDEVAWAVDADTSGNIFWAVEEKDQWPYWYYNIIMFKIDSEAQQIWQSDSWGEAYNEIAFKATVKDSIVYLSGRKDSTGAPTSGDAFVSSYDLIDGSFNWLYHFEPVPDYGYEEIDGLLVQPDGIYISGWTQAQNTNDLDFLIQKINFSGQQLWSNTWDYDSLGRFDGANGHMAMDDHYIYAAGHANRTSISSFDGDGVLACFDRGNGDYQWHVTWGGSSFDDALGMTMSSDSMLYIVGYTGSYGNGSQAYVNKYSRTGQLKWSRMWGGAGAEITRATVTDGDSIIYVVGTTSSYGNGGNDIYVLKFDSAGTLLDSLLWGGSYDEVAHDVARYGDYLYITGDTKSFGNGQINGDHKTDGLLLKVNGRRMQAPDTTITSVPVIQNSENIFSVYPNPFSTSAIIQLNKKTENAQLIVYDIFGQILKNLIVSGDKIKIERENLCTGIYLYEIIQNNKNISSGKLMITD